MVKYDKRKFRAYQTPGVFEVELGEEVKQTSYKKIGFIQKLKNKFKKRKKKVDEFERGRDKVKNIINK